MVRLHRKPPKILVNPDTPLVPANRFLFAPDKSKAPALGNTEAYSRGPTLFRFEQPSEQKLVAGFHDATRIIEGQLTSDERLIGKIDFQVAGHRVAIRIPYFTSDANLPTDDTVLGLSALLTGVLQQHDPDAQVALDLRRVRQAQLDAKILAQLVGRNVARQKSPAKVLNSLGDLIQTVRPDATINAGPLGGHLPAYIVGWSASVKGMADPNVIYASVWRKSGGTIRRADHRRGIMVDQGRHVTVHRPGGPVMTRVTLFVKRWSDPTEWRGIRQLRNVWVGND